jgi:glycosyltransferase involved in cell wall biosynthesis
MNGGGIMKIGMMSRWNSACGVSMHAELIGREWVAMGHDLRVLAPIEYKETVNIATQDENFVTRCYRLDGYYKKKRAYMYRAEEPPFFDPEPFLQEDYDVFVIQNLEIMPMQELLKIFPKIKRRAPTVLVVHEGGLPDDPLFYKFDFDAIVCFDERYKNFLRKVYPEEQIHIIPYPCHPPVPGNRLLAREKLGLPSEVPIIFNYGIGIFRHLHLLPTIERVANKYPLLFLVLTDHPDWYTLFDAVKHRYDFVELRKGAPSVEKLYDYLYASDALLLHKDPSPNVVVSSSVYFCLGSLCPIVAYGTNYVETLDSEVIKYRSLAELEEKLEALLRGDEVVAETRRAAKHYAEFNSSEKIATRFLQLFENLLAAKNLMPTKHIQQAKSIS